MLISNHANNACALWLAFMLSLLSGEINAQTSREKDQVIPPSPNAASLGKFGDIPVSLHTGVVDISVPIYQLREGSLSLPIALRYHSNGIKVAETASWVGLGWALNAGGMISRSVMHIPDEGKKTASQFGYPANPTSNGYYNIGYKLPADIPIPKPGEPVGVPPEQVIFKRAAEGSIDSEPDIFFYNFNGYSGKFMFKVGENATGQLERKPVFIPEADIEVEVNNKAFDSFTLITPDGVKYYFGENGAQEYSVSSTNVVDKHNNNLDKVTSSWYLTRIVSPEGKSITLEYADAEEFIFADLAPERIVTPITGTDYCNSSGKNVVFTTVSGKRLTRIAGSNIEIQFKAETVRADLSANIGLKDSPADELSPSKYPDAYAVLPKRLDKIIIKSVLSTSVKISYKEFAFGYDYFESLADFGANIRGGDELKTDRKRLKLISLTEKSINDQSLPAYQFFYNSRPLARRVSTMQDTYGYFNSRMKSTLINSGACGIIGPDREALFNSDSSAIQAGILTSIKYPTGGVSTFKYELHQPVAGGLRIASIVDKDGSGNTKTKHYKYEYGLVFSKPVYQYDIYWQVFAGKFWKPYPTVPTSLGDAPKFQVFSSASVFPMQTTQGYSIGYPIVTVVENGNGYTRYNYDLSYSFNNEGYPVVTQSSNPLSSYFNGNSSGYPANYSQLFTYKWRPALFKFNRGNLLIESRFNEQDKLVEETINTYETINYEAFTENNIVQATKVELFVMPGSGDEFIMFSHYPIFSGKSRLVKKENKALDHDSGSYLHTTTHFTYGSSDHLLATESRTSNSVGKQIIERTKYSFDYRKEIAGAGEKTAGIRNLIASHVLVPVERYTFEQNADGSNQQVIAGAITTYQEDQPLPAEVKALQIPAPIPLQARPPVQTPAFNPSTINQNGFVSDSRYITHTVFQSYDQKGNIVELYKANDVSKAYLWGYNKAFPVAEIVNANNRMSVSIVPGTEEGFVSYEPNNTNQKAVTFRASSAGAISINLYFGGDPGASATASFDYELTAPGFQSRRGTLCIGCPAVNLAGIPAGDYTLKFTYNYNTSKSNVSIIYSYPVLTVSETGQKEFYYENFEEDTNASKEKAFTGIRCNYGRDFHVKFPKPNARNYFISWRQWDGNQWIFKEEKFTGEKLFTWSLYVDDIRVFPSDAQMATYTYDPLVGMTSSTDANNITTYYEYDAFGRLKLIRDDKGKVIKQVDYKYAGQD